MQQGGPAQQAPILHSSAMERGSDGKSPRHRSEQADRKMLWGEQNLSPLTRGTFVLAARACKRSRRHQWRMLQVAWGMASAASRAKQHRKGLTRTSGRAIFTHTPCAPQTTHRPQDKTLEEGYELHADPPIPPPSNESIHPYLRLPYPGGDAMVGAGEEELKANNSNRNRVEPFQLFICQMDSFPALFFFFLLQK